MDIKVYKKTSYKENFSLISFGLIFSLPPACVTILFLLTRGFDVFLLFSLTFFFIGFIFFISGVQSLINQLKLNKFFNKDYKFAKKIKIELLALDEDITSFHRRNYIKKIVLLVKYEQEYFEPSIEMTIPLNIVKKYNNAVNNKKITPAILTAYLKENETYYINFNEVLENLTKI